MSRRPIELEEAAERALLVGVDLPQRMDGSDEPVGLDESLEELRRLCESAGARVVGQTEQRRRVPDVRTFVGAGKVEEIHQLARERDANLVVFDDPIAATHFLSLSAREIPAAGVYRPLLVANRRELEDR